MGECRPRRNTRMAQQTLQFLGGLTIMVGILCLYVLGTPSEVPWLTPEEKRMANARIVGNQIGHDRTGMTWKWEQVREALIDPVVHFPSLRNLRYWLRKIVLVLGLQRFPVECAEWRAHDVRVHN
jgi:hypothetical protein